jgi:hypothetical protein
MLMNFGSDKKQKIFWLTEQLLASQEGLYYTWLIGSNFILPTIVFLLLITDFICCSYSNG